MIQQTAMSRERSRRRTRRRANGNTENPKKPKKLKKCDNVKYCVGDRVRLTKDRHGTIRYIGNGKTDFSKGVGDRIGIELDKRTLKGHSGRGYFTCKYRQGIFVNEAAIIEKIKSCTNASKQFQIGDYVAIQ
eukprot:336619_1